MSNAPSDLRYAASHEWVRLEEDDTAVIGISDHAQEAMGDLVYVEVPEIDTEVGVGDDIGVVESVKAASDVYAPVSGTVLEVNGDLADSPELVNGDPYGDGWLFKIKLNNVGELEELLSSEDYLAQLEE